MAHISKRALSPEVAERIIETLIESITSAHISDRRGVLRTLLTRTERTMLAKRLAIIAMLERAERYDTIELRLHVSSSTILRLHRQLESGFFKPIQRVFKTSKGWGAFLDAIELLLAGPLPPRGGPRGNRRLQNMRARRKLRLP